MEKLNIAELLKDCPKGIKLYSPIFGDVYLEKIRPHLAIVVTTNKKQGDFKEEFLYDGRYGMNGECMLFPSKGKTTWEGFQRPFKDGDKKVYEDDNNFPSFEPMFKMNDELEYKIPDGYEITKVSKNTVFIKPIKPKYPKTYDECCNVMYGSVANTYGKCIIKVNDGYKGSLIQSFQRLIFYRNVYWKIVGEQMGLDKPWEPAIQDTIWGITRSKDEVEKYSCHYGKTNLLEFPTAEMRDAFYENFKDLIEQCKELL